MPTKSREQWFRTASNAPNKLLAVRRPSNLLLVDPRACNSSTGPSPRSPTYCIRYRAFVADAGRTAWPRPQRTESFR
jgi:hypothetical protein